MMMEQPSPLRYFRAAAEQRRNAVRAETGTGGGKRTANHAADSVSELEGKVLSCFVLAQEIAANLAAVAVTNGVASVELYLPSMHDALAHLQQFHISLAIAPCYGAYTWPNVELNAFADCLADVGIDMKYWPEIGGGGIGSGGKKPAYPHASAPMHAVGVALLQNANKMRELASGAYFFGEDLTRAFVLGWRLRQRAEAIFGELLKETLSAKALRGYEPRTDKLIGFVMEYSQVGGRAR